MKRNMGSLDRNIRFGIAIIIMILYLTDSISGTLASVLMVIVVVLFITSFVNFCPLYYPFGINTRKKTD